MSLDGLQARNQRLENAAAAFAAAPRIRCPLCAWTRTARPGAQLQRRLRQRIGEHLSARHGRLSPLERSMILQRAMETLVTGVRP